MSNLSPPTSAGGPYRKPRADLFTVLLILSLIAVILGTLCMYFEMKRFDMEMEGAPSPPPPMAAITVGAPAASLAWQAAVDRGPIAAAPCVRRA